MCNGALCHPARAYTYIFLIEDSACLSGGGKEDISKKEWRYSLRYKTYVFLRIYIRATKIPAGFSLQNFFVLPPLLVVIVLLFDHNNKISTASYKKIPVI